MSHSNRNITTRRGAPNQQDLSRGEGLNNYSTTRNNIVDSLQMPPPVASSTMKNELGSLGLLNLSGTSSQSGSSAIAGFCFDHGASHELKSPTSSIRSFSSSANEASIKGKCLAGVYKGITGGDIPEEELENLLQFIAPRQDDTKPFVNEAKLAEKLKLHLIHQGKHAEAKKFVELYQKLKSMNILQRRESVLDLLYSLFDKEPTRLALSQRTSRASTNMPSTSNQRTSHHLPPKSQTKELPRWTTPPPLFNTTNSTMTSSTLETGVTTNSSVNSSRREVVVATTTNGAMNTSRPNTGLSIMPLFNSKMLERDLIRDLIFVFQGIDGNLIKSTPNGNYEIVTRTSENIHPSIRLQTLRLCELGYFYKKIRDFCDKASTGLMVQGLKHALRNELQEYYRLLATIQHQTQKTSVDTRMSDDMVISRSREEEMTLLKLTVCIYDCRPRLELLATMVDACENKKGGEICSVLYRYSQHGDPMVEQVSITILSVVAKALYLMLCQWILYGELEDNFNEFFIAADSECKKEHLWQSKYHIRERMLPSFISMKQAEKILSTGKNINFLKEICQNTRGYEGRNEIKCMLEKSSVSCLFLEGERPLNQILEKPYKTTSEMVLKVLIEESKLLDHLKAIKNYLLLGQGDFIQYLLELIQAELSKPASKLFSHNIQAILESAVRATNAQYETEDILARLDTRILTSSNKDLGWDVFCLDYKVQGPIGTVLTEDVMMRYNQLFNTLWRTKRIERILSSLWKNQTALFKYQRILPELGPVNHRSQLLISEMIHFVHQTQYYIMFEATECAWDKLMEEVSRSSDLDEVISAHNKFIMTIISRSLFYQSSRELLNQLRGIFDSVHELKVFLTEFDERVLVELKYRKDLKPNQQNEAQKHFFASYIIQAKGKIEALYTTTQDLIRSFLLVLNRQQDLTLQCLSFRLDFNEYYHFKDSRLSQPLTLQHRRLSSNTFISPLNMTSSMNAFQIVNGSLSTSMSIAESGVDEM